MSEPTRYEYVIEASRGLIRINWSELVQYRDLLFLLVRRDFVSKYKQTVLGPLWFIIQPLLTTVVFTVIFKKAAKLPTGDAPSTLFYLSGLLVWQYFAECLKTTSQTFIVNARLFSKIYFPRLIVPLAVVVSNLMAFALQFATFFGFWIYFKFFTDFGHTIRPNWFIAVLPLLLVQTAAIGLGIGLWMSALTAKYRDFFHLTGFLTQLWMYATLPLFMESAEVSEKLRWLLAVNPMCGIVESYRYALLGVGNVNPISLGISAAMAFFLLFTGLLVFSKVEKTFVDTV